MKRMLQRRILILVQNLPVPFDRRVWREAQALVAAGYSVSVISPKGPGDPSYQELDGVHLYKYSPPPPARGLIGYLLEFVYCWLASARLALRVFRRHGFDAIQACNPPDTYFALALPFKWLGRRFIYDQHDLCPEVYASRFGRSAGLLAAGLRALERTTYRVADHVISTNTSYRQVAIQRGSVKPESVTVVRNGPDARMRRGMPQPKLRQGRRYLACYLGVMGPQDGVDLLIEAAHFLVYRLRRRDCQLALLGFGDCYQDLRAMTQRLELDPWVTFTGRADDQLINAYLSTADVGLSPDPKNPLNDVSTMNKTLEYMAFGLPIVAFDLVETRASAGEAAVYVSPNNVEGYARAISSLLDAPEQRVAQGTIGRKRIEERLAWEHQIPIYISVYNRMLAPPEPAMTGIHASTEHTVSTLRG